jgi:hypothetical protein
MAISNYSELQTAVGNWLNRSDLTSYVPDLIMLGEARIYRKLRIRAMETALNSTIASGVIAVPATYVELKSARIDGTPVQPLTRTSVDNIYHKYPTRSADGMPNQIAREGSNFIFGPYPDSTYTVKGIYYARLTPLSVSNTTNWFTANAPDLLLWAALAEAEVFLKNDERTIVWEAKYQAAAKDVQDEDSKENNSGSPLYARAG